MDILFHITPKENLRSILASGLIPGHKRGLDRGRRMWDRTCVWLTDDPEFILRTQAGKDWCQQYDPVVLHIDIGGLDIQPHTVNIRGYGEHMPHEWPHEWSHEGRIGSERIL